MAMTGEAYLYAILVDGVPRYIGKGRGGRLRDHVRIARRASEANTYRMCKVHRGIRAALEAGCSVVAKKLLVNLTDEVALALERSAIRSALPGTLWNVKDGGSGADLSEACRQVWKRPGYRDLHREITRARWNDPEMRERIISAQAKAVTPSLRRTLADQAKARWRSPDYSEKQREARASRDYKDRTSASVRESMTDGHKELCGEMGDGV